MGLNPADIAKIHSSKREHVVATLAGAKGFVSSSTWVGARNRYSIGAREKIRAEVDAGGIVRPRQLAQYIAASTVLHCTDGWSYLGRALSALLRGDPHRARHLAYYAELRAAMSLLASVGIGVFDNKHFVIDAPTSISAFVKFYGTHGFVWDCLEEWGKSPDSGKLLAEVVRPVGFSLAEWLQPIGGHVAVAAQAQAWFLQWGIDLQVSMADHNVRNVSSYRPDGLHTTWTVNACDVLSFARDFWASMEPSSLSRFENVDSHILRNAVESAFFSTTGKLPGKNRAAFKAMVTRIVQSCNLGTAADVRTSAEKRWIEFLCRESAKADIEILKYARKAPSIDHESHFSVFSRAALLLRMASGSTLSLITDAGFSGADIAFWWSALGSARGVWDKTLPGDVIQDLWADVQPLLDEIENFQGSVAPADQSLFRASNEIVPSILGLGSCERIALWSLVPN